MGRQKNGLDYLPWEGAYRQGGASSFKYCTPLGFKHPGAWAFKLQVEHVFTETAVLKLA